MEELEARFRVSLTGKDELTDFFSRTEQGAKSFERNIGAALSGAGKAISSFASTAKGFMGGLAGGSFNASIASQARGVLQFRDAVSALAVMAGHGNEMVGELKNQIQDVAKASNQLQGDVTEALAAFVEKTGDLDTARRNIELYGKTATATGAALSDVAKVGVELSQKLDVKNQAQSFAVLAAQAKAGAIELKDLARYGPRLFAAAGSAGATGEFGVREAGALAQVVAQGFGGRGSAAMVTTTVENIFHALAATKKRGKIEKIIGHSIAGQDEFEVLKELIAKSGADRGVLQQIFTRQGIRGVEVLAREWRKTGGFATFDRFRDIQANPGLIEKDFATRSQTGISRLRAHEQAFQSFMDRYAGPVAEFAAAHATGLTLGANALGGVGVGMSLLGRLSGTTARIPGGVIGGALGNLTAQRVFVVNWPAGGLGGGMPGVPGAVGGKFGGLMAGAGLVGLASAMFMAAYEISPDKKRLETAKKAFEESGLTLKQWGAEVEKRRQESKKRDVDLRRVESTLATAADVPTLPGGADWWKNPKATVENLTVNINGDSATVEGQTGARAPKVMVRRTAAGAP